MDAAAFARMCAVSREFETAKEFGSRRISIRLRVPTRPAWERLISQCNVGNSPALNYAGMRGTFLPACVVGWSGVVEGDVHPEGTTESLLFNPVHIEEVLTAFPSLGDQAWLDLNDRYEKQEARAREEVKN